MKRKWKKKFVISINNIWEKKIQILYKRKINKNENLLFYSNTI